MAYERSMRIVVRVILICGVLWGTGFGAGHPKRPEPKEASAIMQEDISGQPGYLRGEFIFTKAPFAQCHASTIVWVQGHLVAAWFGGTREKNPDVGIWVSRHENGAWSAPEEVADGVQHAGKRYPCWNPALFQPSNGPLLLFYKVGPSPSSWWGMLKTSIDGGHTWSQGCRLPEDVLGPIKDKPIQLANGDLLSPSSTEDNGWKIHFERTPDLGKSWSLTESLGGDKFEVIQPTILRHGSGQLQALCRSRQGVIVETWSRDDGKSWGPLQASSLPNPNSGIDAVTLADGRQLLVYNHTTTRPGGGGGPRSPLNVAVSQDGKTWQAALVLENQPGEYSYPAVIQTADGLVHITYTWRRTRIKHVVVDPEQLQLQPLTDGHWPE